MYISCILISKLDGNVRLYKKRTLYKFCPNKNWYSEILGVNIILGINIMTERNIYQLVIYGFLSIKLDLVKLGNSQITLI